MVMLNCYCVMEKKISERSNLSLQASLVSLDGLVDNKQLFFFSHLCLFNVVTIGNLLY